MKLDTMQTLLCISMIAFMSLSSLGIALAIVCNFIDWLKDRRSEQEEEGGEK